MATRVFVTGGSGFVGSRLLPVLGRRGYSVVALDRSGSLLKHAAERPEIEVVPGDLLQPETYRHALATADIVVHLAAATGRATQEEHFRVNARGTEALLEACRAAGVQRILFVSSIAATFPNTTRYYYAQAKIRAEQVVRESGLRFAILRPTMILGPGSPVLTGLEKLATLPVIPVFGSGRTMVQPVYVDDVVEFILTVLDDDLFSNETFAIGGPTALTVEELFQRVRQTRKGARGRVLHIPLGLVLAPLWAAEAIGLGGALPVTVGQLSSFRNDGTAATNSLFEGRRDQLVDVSQMLSRSFSALTAGTSSLDRECRVFTQFLLGCSPDAYVMRKYTEAHDVLAVLSAGGQFETFLLGFARVHRVFAKIADAYARVFAPGSLLRRKLVVLLAILETCSPFHRLIDQTIGGSTALLFARMAVRAGSASVSLLVGAIIFVPTRLVLSAVDRRAR